MNAISSRAAASRMRKEYGEDILHNCCGCCNCQLKKKGLAEKICIAYSSCEPWNAEELACGLWNVPFLSLRPKRKQLIENYISKAKRQEQNDLQYSLF